MIPKILFLTTVCFCIFLNQSLFAQDDIADDRAFLQINDDTTEYFYLSDALKQVDKIYKVILTSCYSKEFLDSILSLKELESLSLSQCGYSSVPNKITLLPKFHTLWVYQTPIKNYKFVLKLKRLKSLSIVGSFDSNNDTYRVVLPSNMNVTHLYLSHNRISLPKKSFLKNLVIILCTKEFPKQIFNYKNLEYLYINREFNEPPYPSFNDLKKHLPKLKQAILD